MHLPISLTPGLWSPGTKRQKKRERRLHREPIVRRIADILVCGVSSKFEYEASCRHGLRAALCLQGQSWREADKFAAAVVELALHRIGAARPLWVQGQPEATERTVQHFFCKGCGRPLGDGDGGRLYCSSACKSTSKSRQYNANYADAVAATRLALQAARAKGEPLKRTCELCGTEFVIRSGSIQKLVAKYCSRACATAVLASQARRAPRPCQQCGKPFKPTSGTRQMYCSRACKDLAVRKVREPRKCGWCGTEFFPTKPAYPKKYCSQTCASKAMWRDRKAQSALTCEAVD